MRRLRRALAVLLAVGAAVEGALLAGVLWREHAAWPLHEAEALIVPGALVLPDGKPGDTLQKRLDVALDLWREGWARAVIVCGGQGSDEPAAECDVMARYLIARGVPIDRVFRERASANTYGNMSGAKRVMDRLGARSAMVVTSSYHVTRAVDTARRVGIEAYGCAAPPPAKWTGRWFARLRETLSWIKFYVVERGWKHGPA